MGQRFATDIEWQQACCRNFYLNFDGYGGIVKCKFKLSFVAIQQLLSSCMIYKVYLKITMCYE